MILSLITLLMAFAAQAGNVSVPIPGGWTDPVQMMRSSNEALLIHLQVKQAGFKKHDKLLFLENLSFQANLIPRDENDKLVYRNHGHGIGVNILLDRFANDKDPEVLLKVLEVWGKFRQDGSKPGDRELLRKVAAQVSEDPAFSTLKGSLEKIYAEYPALHPSVPRDSYDKGMVPVSSDYQDGKSKRTLTGTGWILQEGEEKYLVTSSHLLGGANKRVRVGDEELKIEAKNLLVDNDNDLAVAQLTGVNPAPGLVYDTKKRIIDTTKEFQQSIYDGEVRTRSDYFPESKFFHITYMAPWAEYLPAVAMRDPKKGGRRSMPVLTSHGKEIQVFDKTTPGMSGTVLVGGKEVADFKVLGFLSQYNYFFDDSYYTAAPLAMDLIDKFRAGQRGSISDTTWHMRNGLTYRQFGTEATEANFVNAPAGVGQYLDAGGKGTYGDPGGKGTYGDPGAGESTPAFLDPELPCGEETAELLKMGVAAEDILQALLRTPELAPNEVYYRYGIRPGLIWHGQRTLGFMLKEKGKDPFPIYANAQALAFLRDNPGRYEVEPIAPDANLLDVLKAKASYAFGKNAIPEGAANIQLESSDKNGGLLNLTFSSEGAKIHLHAPARRSSRDFVDDVAFELDQNGRLKGSAFFTPILETKGSQSRNRYFVDVRNLFFVDIASVAQPLDSNTVEADFAAALERQKKLVSVDMRDDLNELEQTYSLSPR